MDNRMTRRRIALYTQQEAADATGLPLATIAALERSFLTDAQRAYLELVGYCVGYYPRKNRKNNAEHHSATP